MPTTTSTFQAHGKAVQVRTTSSQSSPTSREVWVETIVGESRCWKAVGFLTHDAAGRASGAFARWGFQPYSAPYRRIPGIFTTRAAVLNEFVARHGALLLDAHGQVALSAVPLALPAIRAYKAAIAEELR